MIKNNHFESNSIHEYQNDQGVSIMKTPSQNTMTAFLRTLTSLSIPHVKISPHMFTSQANILL